MLENKTGEYLQEVKDFAKSIDMAEQLQSKLDYLGDENSKWFGRESFVRLYTDFAPYSFYWERFVNIEVTKHGGCELQEERVMSGGLIFHGAHERGGDGGAPTFSVSLTPHTGWSIHT